MNAAPAYGMEQGDGSKAAQLQAQFNRKFQHYLDKSVPTSRNDGAPLRWWC